MCQGGYCSTGTGLHCRRPKGRPMPLRTRLTEMLAIRQPVLLAPMDLVSDARLTAAVSAAGGLGILGGGYGDAKWLQAELDALAASGKRFGVGFITWSLARQPLLLDAALERAPVAVMLSFGDPRPFMDRIKRRRSAGDLPGAIAAGCARRSRGRRRRPGGARHRGRRPWRVARLDDPAPGARRYNRRERPRRRCRRDRRRPRPCCGAHARRVGSPPGNALLRVGGSCRRARGQEAHLRCDR